MPASYIEGKVPKLIVRDVFRNISRYSCAKKYQREWDQILRPLEWEVSVVPLDYSITYGILDKKGNGISADNLR